MCDLRSSIDTWRTNNFQHKNKSRIACGSSSRWLWLTNPLLRHQNMQYLHTQRQCISQCHCLSSAIQAAVAFEFIDFLHPVPGSRLRSKQICFSYANTTHSNQNTSQAAGRLSLLMLRLLVWSALRLLDLKKPLFSSPLAGADDETAKPLRNQLRRWRLISIWLPIRALTVPLVRSLWCNWSRLKKKKTYLPLESALKKADRKLLDERYRFFPCPSLDSMKNTNTGDYHKENLFSSVWRIKVFHLPRISCPPRR